MRVLYPLVLLFCTQIVSAQMSESITFIDPNGVDTISYSSLKSRAGSYSIYFVKRTDATVDDYLEHYLYINPLGYQFDNSGNNFDKIIFPNGAYSSINRKNIAGAVTQSDDGTRIYNSCRDCKKLPNGHYGSWYDPENFKKFTKAWVFPSNFEVVKYTSNRKGEWKLRYNTLTYYGSNVNDLIFEIYFRSKSIETMSDLRRDLTDDNIEIAEGDDGVRVSFSENVLFSSGSAELNESGQKVLNKLAELVKDKDHSVVVEGHTDDIPIQGSLKDVYDTNWELSAARSLAVVRYLASVGISENRLESRAFAEHRPRADNSTAEGRARGFQPVLRDSHRGEIAHNSERTGCG